MLRLFTALLFASVALAEDPPVRPLPPKPADPVAVAPAVSVSLRTLNVKDGMVVTTVTVPVTETVPVTVTKTVNGQPVTVVEQVPVTKMVVQEKMTKLKDLKATGTDGKAVDGEAVEKALKGGGVVVAHFGKLDDKYRKLFKDGTLFVEDAPPAPPVPPKPPKP